MLEQDPTFLNNNNDDIDIHRIPYMAETCKTYIHMVIHIPVVKPVYYLFIENILAHIYNVHTSIRMRYE